MKKNTELFLNSIYKLGIGFVTGVPDSVLAPLCEAFATSPKLNHVTAVNEGSALGLAIGSFLGSNKIPLIYLQNSGLGNIINPYVSLAHEDIYSIPCIFLIGWRGEPGFTDEPQHLVQGKLTIPMLEILGIPHFIIRDGAEIEDTFAKAVKVAKIKNSGVAILVSNGLFEKTPLNYQNESLLSRKEALELIILNAKDNSMFVSTTGKTSRELDEILSKSNEKRVFLTIGGMGFCSSIALGLNLSHPNKFIYCLDGDGALQMHLGALATIGKFGNSFFNHFVFDNGVHESVGGQEISNPRLNYELLAKSCGYKNIHKIYNKYELIANLNAEPLNSGPNLIIIKVNKHSSTKLSRPKGKPIDWKNIFMSTLEDSL